MLQIESNSNKNSSLNNIIPKTDKQADIVKRLGELNKWQEEQKQLLETRQTMQREMLGLEQQTMYQMLGLQGESEVSEQDEVVREFKEEERILSKEQEIDSNLEYELEEYEVSLETSQLEEDDIEEHQNKEEPCCSKTLKSGYAAEDYLEVNQQRPKKSFLKRGDGLKQRFKIDPDELRLNNLPKYKYANAHPRLRLKPPVKQNQAKNFITTQIKLPKSAPKATETVTLDDQEQRFQNLLISSKNSCSSTPDIKSSCALQQHTNATSSTSSSSPMMPKVRFLEPKSQISPNEKSPIVTPIVAWSKILDSQQLTPLEVPRDRLQSLPQTEESIFELLEQKALNGSFDMNSTCLKQFMERRLTEKLNETVDDIPVEEEVKAKRIEPLVSEIIQEEPSSSMDELEESQLTEDVETTDSEETIHETVETTNCSFDQQNQVGRVRFSESNETHEYDRDNDPTEDDSTRLSAGAIVLDGQGDTTNNEFFDQFKQALFAALQIKSDQHLANDTILNSSDTTLTPKDSSTINNSIISQASKDLQHKTDMIQHRLSELEKEINNFKENNIILMKAKQEHELEKSLNAQEHLEAMDRVKDEKIHMEIYLHDERVKLEEEKRQFEQSMKMKTQGLVAKERKENERLREQLSKLEMELKAKDVNHTSAQARIRSQLRNLERDQKKLHEQIEALSKENKRLENENLRISREQNNKILQEINRNIAKLAPKQIQNSSTSMPEEGPPTIGRTVSKCIVSAATANKHYRSPLKKYEKTRKQCSTRFSIAKSTKKVNSPLSSAEGDTTPESSFTEDKEQNIQQQAEQYLFDIVDDEDILQEFKTSPTRRNNIPQISKQHIINKEDKTAKHQKQQHLMPTPPPPSPRNSNTIEMKREIVNEDGSKDIWYPNGNLKKISADGMVIRMLYYNKDIKETNINEGTVKYYYSETNTWHTTYLDGLEILEFPNGQIEHRHKSGIVEVHYPNNSVKIMNPKDEHKQEEWRFADGTHLLQMRNGDKILSLPNGQKEIHNKLHKRREYPDGTVKIVYPDGSTETRYSNGRVRLKDKDGKLVMDTDMSK